MKNKILLSVKLPASGRTYEFRVPLDSTVDQSAKLISHLIASCEPARYEESDGADLVLLGTAEEGGGRELNPNETFRALANQGVLVDGSRIALA
ncbi:MAG: hypothetical protein ACI364_03190 [Coriobacteriales bacterium]